MNMSGLLIKRCTRIGECAWRSRCDLATQRKGALPITPRATADGCDWFAEKTKPWGAGPDTEEND